MIVKYLIVAAALSASTGALARPITSTTPAAHTHTARAAVLDNIIGRVQMDALIATVVPSEVPVAATGPRLIYASNRDNRQRNRS